MEDVQVFPDVKGKKALVKINLANPSGRKFAGKLRLEANSFNSPVLHQVAPVEVSVNIQSKEQLVEIELPLGDEMQTWDEFDPSLYRLQLRFTSGNMSDLKSVQFGMREMSIEGKYIYINGYKTVLRGTVENALFPLTGYPPTDVASWERVFRICKAWGLNHMRYHSYCPPEAAFIAADKVGIYLQPEGPSWPNHTTQLGRGLPIDTYLMDETKRLVKQFGNYASFTFMAAGNEPRGNWVPWVSKFVDYWKATDSRRLYTGASVGGSWAWQPNNQFHVKAGVRGLQWRGSRPETMRDFRPQLDTVRQPYVSHETGQWCVFPNFDEIKKYTGVTRARNFELFKEVLADNDMAHLSREFLMASGKLQALCYKHEIERTLRTPEYAGFQLLSLNDYSGQGTALVGVLDAFWDEKGYITAPEFRRFCNATVLLSRIEKFVFRNNENFSAAVEASHFAKYPIENARVVWRLKDKFGLVLNSGVVSKKTISVGSNVELGEVEFSLNGFKENVKLNFEVAIEGTDIVNDWDLWVYPAQLPKVAADDVYVTDSLDSKAIETLNKGGKVLVLAAGKVSYGKEVEQHYQPAFWNTSWFKMRPPHTTGVFVNHYHPVFNDFETDNWGSMQWWELINRAQTMLLTDFPKGFQPIVQPIDTWFINRKLGMLIEAKVGNGKLMVTSCDLKSRLNERPVAQQMYYSIIKYMSSDKFRPENTIQIQQIKDLFEKTAEPYNFFTKSSPDELRQGVK